MSVSDLIFKMVYDSTRFDVKKYPTISVSDFILKSNLIFKIVNADMRFDVK